MKKGQSLWNYYHGENAWPIVHAFNSNNTDSIELSDAPILKQKLREVAEVEHNNHLRGGIVNIVGQSEISWLIAMRKLGYRYVCMWFDGCWSATDEVNLKLLDEINRINDEFGIDKWMVAGNILQTDLCALLNVQKSRPKSIPWLMKPLDLIWNIEPTLPSGSARARNGYIFVSLRRGMGASSSVKPFLR